MKNIVLVIAVLICANAKAQNTFFLRTYGQNLEDVGYSLIRAYDRGFVLIGTSTQFDVNANATIRKIDSLGTELWAYDIGFSGSIEYPVGALELQDSSILLAVWSNAANTKLRQVKLSKEGTVLMDSIYYLSDGFPDVSFLELIQLPDGRIIMPALQNDSTLKCFWWNQNGDTLFSKQIYNNNLDVNSNKISIAKAFIRGAVITFCIRNDSPQPAPWSVIRVTDLDGNVSSGTTFQDPFLSGCSYSYGNNSKLFIYYPSMSATQINYARFDVAGDTLIDSQTYLESGIKLAGLGAYYSDSSIFVCGKRQINFNDTIKSLLINLDTNGVVQWVKTYLPIGYDEVYFQTVNVFPDCIAAIGTASNSSNPDSVDIFFLKANLNGGITEISEFSIESSFIKVFPNPASDLINVNLLPIGESVYTIVDAGGREVLKGKTQSNQIRISSLPAGCYQLLWENDGKMYHAGFMKE